MPAIRFILCQPDSIFIAKNNGVTVAITRAQIPAGTLSGAISDIETFVNGLLVTQMAGTGTALVHIFQVNPQLIWTVGVGNVGAVFPPVWW